MDDPYLPSAHICNNVRKSHRALCYAAVDIVQGNMAGQETQRNFVAFGVKIELKYHFKPCYL